MKELFNFIVTWTIVVFVVMLILIAEIAVLTASFEFGGNVVGVFVLIWLIYTNWRILEG